MNPDPSLGLGAAALTAVVLREKSGPNINFWAMYFQKPKISVRGTFMFPFQSIPPQLESAVIPSSPIGLIQNIKFLAITVLPAIALAKPLEIAHAGVVSEVGLQTGTGQKASRHSVDSISPIGFRKHTWSLMGRLSPLHEPCLRLLTSAHATSLHCYSDTASPNFGRTSLGRLSPLPSTPFAWLCGPVHCTALQLKEYAASAKH